MAGPRGVGGIRKPDGAMVKGLTGAGKPGAGGRPTAPWRQRLGRVFGGSGIGAYLRVVAVGSGARMFGLASQFVVLILLSRVLSKAAFGEMMIAFGIYRVIGTALGVGGSLVLLFHISRHPDDRAAEVRLHRSSALLAGAASCILALAGALGSGWIAAALNKPALAEWMVLLAPFAVFSTLLVVATGALEGRSRVSESILIGEVAPSAARIVLLPLAALLALPESAVAHVLTLSVLVPWLWASRRIWARDVPGLRAWTAWDYQYCAKFVGATLFANQLGAIDLVVAGALFPSAIVADYAVASRIAALYAFFQLILLKRFAPRAGHLLQVKDEAALRNDTALCRRLTIGCTALTIAGILLVAPYVLPLFGGYGGAMTFLVWLAVPSFVTSFYATSDRLLVIAGKADILLALTVSSFLLLALSPHVTAPWLGSAAIPAAMILSAVLLNPIVAVYARRLYGIVTIRASDVAIIALVCATLVYHARTTSLASTLAVCLVLGSVGATFLVSASGSGWRLGQRIRRA
jgi:O-antigen/teichoic acid export membrane protein